MPLTLTLQCRLRDKLQEDHKQKQKQLDERSKQLDERSKETDKMRSTIENKLLKLQLARKEYEYGKVKFDKWNEQIEQARILMEFCKLREERVAAREKEIKEFRKHGKGARSAA